MSSSCVRGLCLAKQTIIDGAKEVSIDRNGRGEMDRVERALYGTGIKVDEHTLKGTHLLRLDQRRLQNA